MRYQSTLGLDDAQVEELVRRIEQVLQTRPRPLMMPKILDLEEQVMIVLLLVRQNLSQMLVADLLGVSQPTISRVYRAVMPLLDQATCINEPDFEEVSANRTTIVDGTDVPTRNRKDVGKDNYSGKRHRQGLNIQVAATTSGSLLGVSTPVPGCRHDRRAITECGWEALLDRRDWIADPGYQGTTARTPKRKPPGKDLTNHEKEVNKSISSVRSAGERCIAHLKNWKILASGYRGILRELPNIIRIISRLEFYRLGW